MKHTLTRIKTNLHTLHTELHTDPLSTRPHSQTGVRTGTTGSTPPCNITSLDYLIQVQDRLTELCTNISADLTIPIPTGTYNTITWCRWLHQHWDNLDPLTWKEDLEQELTDLDAELQARVHPTQPNAPKLPDWATASEIAAATGKTTQAARKWLSRHNIDNYTQGGKKHYRTSMINII